VGVVDLVFALLRSLFTLSFKGCSGLGDLCVALSPPSSATPRIQPGGPVRGAGLRGSAGRRVGQARRCLPSPSPLCSMDALRPSRLVLPLSSDAHRATRRGFGWPPGSSDAYSELSTLARPHGSRVTGSLTTRHSPLATSPITAGDPNVSALRPPARRPPDPPPMRYCLRSKTPSAAHRLRRNSFRPSAPS